MNRAKEESIILTRDLKARELSQLSGYYPLKPFQEHKLIPESVITGFYERDIRRLISDKKSSWAVAVRKNGKITGLSVLKKLPWESGYFGIGMAKVSYLLSCPCGSREEYRIKSELFRKISELSYGENIRHLCFETDARDPEAIHAAESNGFELMVTQLIYIRNKENLTGAERLEEGYIVRLFRKKDISRILKIAVESKAVSRFHADKRLPEDKRRMYYRVKTLNCCLGKIADAIFVLEKNKQIIGFYIFQRYKEILKPSMGYVVSVALASEFQGRGIGADFIREVDARLLKKVDILTGKAHIANIPMIRAMNKANAEIIYATHTFHKWIR